MRRASYEEILRGACEQAGIPFGDLSTTDFQMFRTWAGLELQAAWEQERWPELMRVEKRYLRALYASATSYTAPTEVYFAGTGKYYLALRSASFSGQDPATKSGGVWTQNKAYWAECAKDYSANDWVTATAYAVGDWVYYSVTDKYYACHTAHTSSGTLVPNATGGNERWGELVAFDPYVSYTQAGKTEIGEVFRACDRNPRVFTTVSDYGFELSDNGVQFNNGGIPSEVWLEFRLRCPELKGDQFSATATYVVNQQIYYSNSAAALAGNFYKCLVNTTAGQDPEDTPASWEIVELPWIFKKYLSGAMYGRWLKEQERPEEAMAEGNRAAAYLSAEGGKLWRQQGQVRRPLVGAR